MVKIDAYDKLDDVNYTVYIYTHSTVDLYVLYVMVNQCNMCQIIFFGLNAALEIYRK